MPPERFTKDLLVVDLNGYPELSLSDPYAEPPELTWREYFYRYYSEDLLSLLQQRLTDLGTGVRVVL